MQLICPTGGTYWNPKPFWWVRNSWVGVGAIRILQLARFLGWLAASILSFIGTLVLGVIFPLILWLWTLTTAFINFYVGLLMGTIVVEVLVFLPFFLLGFAWLVWLFWPELGCWLEMAWPAFRTFLDIAAATIRVVLQLFNLVIRIWDNLVPVIGFFMYIVVEINVQIYRSINLLIGEQNISVIFDALIAISSHLAELIVNLTEAFISVSTTLLQVFSTVAGAVMTVVLEVSPVLLEMVTFLLRIIAPQLGPIVHLIVEVVTYVKKTFFARALLEVATTTASVLGTTLGSAASFAHLGMSARLADTPGEPRNHNTVDAHSRIFRGFGESASRYWTAETARRSEAHLDRMSAWLIANPAGTYSSYYINNGYFEQTQAESYYWSGHSPIKNKRSAGDIELESSVSEKQQQDDEEPPAGGNKEKRYSDIELPSGWNEAQTEQEQNQRPAGSPKRTRHMPYELGEGPLNPDPMHYLSEKERERHYNGHVRLSDSPIEDDLRKRLPCHSRFCGGEGHTVAHPLLTIAKTHKRDRTLMVDRLATDVRSQRKRQAHGAAVIYAVRHAAHNLVRNHLHPDSDLKKHVHTVWKHYTGHDSFQSAMETWLSRYDDPMDSILGHMPILSEHPPFKWILDRHPPEEQEKYYGRWAAKRAYFIAEVTDEATGEKRRLLHITLAERNDSSEMGTWLRDKRGEDWIEMAKAARQRQLRQVTLGPGAMTQKSQPVNTDCCVFLPPIFLAPDPVFGAIGVIGGLSVAYAAGRFLEPALPVIKMLSTRNCYTAPKHPWCIPEIPSQLNCILDSLIRKIPRNLPVTLCGYEKECADIGFCIHARPDITHQISLVKSRSFLISWCWFQNAFVWLGIVAALLFSALRLSFEIAALIIPLFGPLIFEPLRRLTPELITQQQTVCLIIFGYGIVMVIILLYMFRFLWPLFLWLQNTLLGLLTMIDAIRGLELARYDAIMSEPWYQEMLEREDRMHRHVLHGDTVFGGMFPVHFSSTRRFYDPAEATSAYGAMSRRPPGSGYATPSSYEPDVSHLPADAAREATVRGSMYSPVPLPQPLEQRIGADAENNLVHLDRENITPEGQHALDVFVRALHHGTQLFGHAPCTVTVDDVRQHEAQWHPIIHTGHYSWTWIRMTIAQRIHERDKYASRRPPRLGYMKTLFHWDS